MGPSISNMNNSLNQIYPTQNVNDELSSFATVSNSHNGYSSIFDNTKILM